MNVTQRRIVLDMDESEFGILFASVCADIAARPDYKALNKVWERMRDIAHAELIHRIPPENEETAAT